MGFTEKETKEAFLKKAPELLPELKILKMPKDTVQKYHQIDLVFKIKLGKLEKIILGEVKAKGEPRYIFQAVAKIKSYSKMTKNSIPLIIAPHIGEKGRQICKEFNVGYIDLNGNIWLKIDSITIEKKGSNHIEREYRYSKNIFAKKATKILRFLLLNYKKSWKLEHLSEITGLSISYTHKVVKTTEKLGYTKHKKGKGVKVTRPDALLLDWAQNYSFLKDNQIKGFYTLETEHRRILHKIKEISERKELNYALTLFSGANYILPFVRHNTFHMYVNKDDFEIWGKNLGLEEAEAGQNFYLAAPYDESVYWGSQNINDANIVSDIQLFLDLYNYPSRGKEQAMLLKQRKIKFM